LPPSKNKCNQRKLRQANSLSYLGIILFATKSTEQVSEQLAHAIPPGLFLELAIN
jgi:hypothetical protein